MCKNVALEAIPLAGLQKLAGFINLRPCLTPAWLGMGWTVTVGDWLNGSNAPAQGARAGWVVAPGG